jgi:hypothetical protein
MPGYSVPEPPHRDDCTCECHEIARRGFVTDAECGSPPSYGPWCCYGRPGGPKHPPCELCGETYRRLKEVEECLICRSCRRNLKT